MIQNKIERSYKLIDIKGLDCQKTLYFDVKGNFVSRNVMPGQFFMLNYNGKQKPFSFSHFDGHILGMTIQARGECTAAMLAGKVGEYYGITGPLGKGFDCNGQRFLLVAGGIGTAPVYYYAQYLLNQGKHVDVVFGARTGNLLDYTQPLKEHITYYTDDGSFGKKGFVTENLANLLHDGNYDVCGICGPEKMMKVAADEASKSGSKTKIQISMERYMKCGVGICGSCVLDDIGARVCSEGPVFNLEDLQKCKEFGVYHRNGYGQIEK